MHVVTDRPEAPTAIRTDLGAIFVSLELSRSRWLITSLSVWVLDPTLAHIFVR